MRVVFFGSGAFGLPTLERLARDFDVVMVVTQPDRPAGRNRAVVATPIGQFAQSNGLPLINPHKVNDVEIVDRIRSAKAEAFVVIAFGQKLGPALLDGQFAINLHGSLLPKYRGAAPVQWAVISGDRESGLSVIALAQHMDAGDILAHAATAIDPMETAGELHDRLAAMGPNLVVGVLDQFSHGKLKPIPQDESKATSAPRLSKSDGTVRFDQPASRVQQRVHGLTPWPGCTVLLSGKRVRLARVQAMDRDGSDVEPGTILDDFTIACAPGGALRILELQPAGGKVMSFNEYHNGHPVQVGSRCESI